MTTIELRSERDYLAWYAMFADLDRQTAAIETMRSRLAQELGFERVHIDKIRSGDRVRTGVGGWYTVDRVDAYLDGHPARVKGYPYYCIVFEGACGTYEVEANHPGHPWAPLVTRAWDEADEPF